MVSGERVLLTFWDDPGHAWLEVPEETMRAAGLAPREVSGYSYVDRMPGGRGRLFYLEEDCDAALFMAAAKRNGMAVEIEEREDKAGRIRRLAQWAGQEVGPEVYRAAVKAAYQELAA